MAKIKVVGDAVVVVSAFTLEALKKVEKYRPEALILHGGEDGKDEIFRIGVATTGTGSLSFAGAEFAGVTKDDAKRATITMVSPVSGENMKDAIAEKYGVAVLKINKIEELLGSTIAEIETEKAQILANIELE